MNRRLPLEEKHVLLKSELDEKLQKKHALELEISQRFEKLRKLEIHLEKRAEILKHATTDIKTPQIT